MRIRLTAPVLFAVSIAGLACAKDDDPRGAWALQAAVEVGEYLIDLSRPAPLGIAWPDDGYKPIVVTTGLDHGMAGSTLFFTRLADRTGEQRHRDMIVHGADYLWARVPNRVAVDDEYPPSTRLYDGLPGMALVLRNTFGRTDDPRYADGARRCFEFMNVLAHRDGGNIWWNDAHGLQRGTAGIGLYLLREFDVTADVRAIELATGAREDLRRRQILTPEGWTWPIGPPQQFVVNDADVSLRDKVILPGRAHGAAGIGSFFIETYVRTGNVRDLERAIEAGAYLEHASFLSKTLFLTPVRADVPLTEAKYRIGWSDGIAGVARFFHHLYQATEDPRWKLDFDRCVNAIHDAGYPDRPLAEFDDGTEAPFRPDIATGSAAAASVLLLRYRMDRYAGDLELAWEIVEDIVEASRFDGGVRWWDVDPLTGQFVGADTRIEGVRAPTGYLDGAAGYGLLLLEFEATVNGCEWAPLGIE